MTKDLLKQNVIGLSKLGYLTSFIDEYDKCIVMINDTTHTYERIENTENFKLAN